ncbi:mercuric reductase [Micromonospora echinofusca]|uniref:Mercuric reductase n=1 Tax=Micromonospora echinofusca TaxID=47858 RepID=A0A1C5G9D2_MICEH|nr:mercury(II) reductase [Micromonospora echinofusca]SCG15626.1 mercuric reductase [Micromonospora echinofusca]
MAYDLAIVGSGGGAFAAAIAARRRDLSVVIVEKGTVGGACVNTGCVPSKALLAAADARHTALAAGRFPGLRPAEPVVDFAALIDGKRGMVETMRADKYVDLAAEYGWQILPGTARFTGDPDQPRLAVEQADGGTRTIEAAQYVVATGSTPWVPPIAGLADAGYLTSTTAMDLDRLPESMIVIGGNAIGLEQAQLFARLGTRVTVVETVDRLAPFEEPEISTAIEGVFADEGITVHTGATVTAVARGDAGYSLTLTTGHGTIELAAERLLVATGRRPLTQDLNLDQVGVTVGRRGEIIVDERLRSSNRRIWAAGDVTGHPQFVYVAGAHGTLIVDNAFDNAGRSMDYTHLPRVIFTTPAIAAVGLTDAQAAEQGLDCECRVLPLDFVPRAIVNRDTRGLVKIVAERGSGRIRGVHVLADNAGDVIAAAVYAVQAGMTVAQMADTWCPYLTMAEGLKLAAQTFTRDVAKLSCCAS